MINSRHPVWYCLFICLFFIEKASAQITATITTHGTTCGLNNGTARAIPAGGGPVYTYTWSGGTPVLPANDSVFGLAAGPYSVTVVSGIDTTIQNFNIASSVAPTVTISAASDSFCLRSGDLLTATASSGGGVYTWKGPAIPGGTSNANPVLAMASAPNATYLDSVFWTDGVCTAFNSLKIYSYNSFVSNQAVLQPTCGQANGMISFSSSLNTRQFTFLKSGTVIQQGNSYVLPHAGIGTYTVVADLAYGCSDTIGPIVLSDNSSFPTISAVAVTGDSCYARKGAIAVTLSNCTNCTYSWSYSRTNTTTTATGLHAGVDTFHVSMNGCTIDSAIIVPGPAAVMSSTLRIHDDHCGQSTGSAIALTTGGSAPYTYSWNVTSQATDSVHSLKGDTNLVVGIKDFYGCVDTARGRIRSTGAPGASLGRADTICLTEAKGSMTVTPRGSSPFTYLWSGGQTTATASGLTAGAVAVKVTDFFGCDTVVHGNIPFYQPSNRITATPTQIFPGSTSHIVLVPNVKVKDATWSPYLPGSDRAIDQYVNPDTTTMYTIKVTYGDACEIFDTVIVTVIQDTTPKVAELMMPNTFTPNNDGTNDEFTLLSAHDISTFHIWIYDRWGNKMFESTDMSFRWDGTNTNAGNEPLSTGVFAYVVEYVTTSKGTKKIVGGNISLVK